MLSGCMTMDKYSVSGPIVPIHQTTDEVTFFTFGPTFITIKTNTDAVVMQKTGLGFTLENGMVSSTGLGLMKSSSTYIDVNANHLIEIK